MYRRVARWEKACTGERRYAPKGSVIAHRRVAGCAQEGSVVVRRRVALYTGGQRDCIQEGSVAMAGCHSLLN